MAMNCPTYDTTWGPMSTTCEGVNPDWPIAEVVGEKNILTGKGFSRLSHDASYLWLASGFPSHHLGMSKVGTFYDPLVPGFLFGPLLSEKRALQPFFLGFGPLNLSFSHGTKAFSLLDAIVHTKPFWGIRLGDLPMRMHVNFAVINTDTSGS